MRVQIPPRPLQMPTQSLANKYRPQRFADVVGNELIRNILQNSVAQNNLRFAYFLAGGKGSGKTSLARIFAKAVNCSGRQEHESEPCCTCASCQDADRQVMDGDIMEIDAASQNSVASVKSLINLIGYPPRFSAKRLVILDECHMLSTAASSTLLKTLEEPPDHVIFIFCTTDPQKVIGTIRSRTFNMEFQKLTSKEVADRLIYVAAAEGLELESEAATLIGSAVNGAMRDAITVLDQASILSNKVDVATVARIIGYVPLDKLYDLFSHVYAGSHKDALAWLDIMVDKLDQDVITSCFQFIETLMLLNTGADVSRRIPKDLAESTKKLSSVFGMRHLHNMGQIAASTLLEYRRLSLRDSKVLLRLMVVGFILAKDEQHKDTHRKPLHELVSAGPAVKLDAQAVLRKLFGAEKVEVSNATKE